MLKPIKDLGQNFLTDISVAEDMVRALQIQPDDLVVEIGAGLGALTKVLAEVAGGLGAKVLAVEVDERCVQKLRRSFSKHPNLEIIEADILSWLPKFNTQRSFKLVGSLPYYISSPILHEVVKKCPQVSKAVFMVQKEVAGKLVKKAPDASYLSTYLQTFFETDLLRVVPSTSFEPVPQVDGAVVSLARIDRPLVDLDQQDKYKGFLHKGFSKPRKMLNKVFSKELLAEVGLDEKLRPQHLPVEKWADLFKRQTL